MPESVLPSWLLPYGSFSPPEEQGRRLGVLAGEFVCDLPALASLGLLDVLPIETREAARAVDLGPVLRLSRGHWTGLRARLLHLLSGPAADDHRGALAHCLHDRRRVRVHLPFPVGDYTDFYASLHHATNVGTMLRPDQPLFPNYRHVPIGYHGRASSVVVSGTPIRRPLGQTLPQGASAPVFGPSQRLDYELEVGLVVGGENPLGEPVPIGRAHERIFGMVLLNDWSARDIQAWEYQPLGPFLAKSFATSISGWVVTLDALAATRCPAAPREAAAPMPLPYLTDQEDQRAGAFDIPLEVHLTSTRMRDEGQAPVVVSRSNLRDLYWTPAQLVAHHTSNGCNLRPGDLLGTGTVSGSTPESRGCLLERTWRGTQPLVLPTGETRRFLEDGDEVRLWSPHLGECTGIVDPTGP